MSDQNRRKRPGRAAAINAKCKDCIYDHLEPGTWRQQTEACTITDCPLWPYRPVSRPRREAADEV